MTLHTTVMYFSGSINFQNNVLNSTSMDIMKLYYRTTISSDCFLFFSSPSDKIFGVGSLDMQRPLFSCSV